MFTLVARMGGFIYEASRGCQSCRKFYRNPFDGQTDKMVKQTAFVLDRDDKVGEREDGIKYEYSSQMLLHNYYC